MEYVNCVRLYGIRVYAIRASREKRPFLFEPHWTSRAQASVHQQSQTHVSSICFQQCINSGFSCFYPPVLERGGNSN